MSGADSISGMDVKVIDLMGTAEPLALAGTPAIEWGPPFSGDGRYLAYISDESGRDEIYVKPFPPDLRRWQVSTDGGEEPIWSRTGRELFYRRGLEWISVEVATSPGFTMKKSGVVISGNYLNVPGRSFDVTRDGNQFLALDPCDARMHLTEIRVITHWYGEVEAKVKGR